MADIPVPQIILDQARVDAHVGECKPAGVTQHMRMDGDADTGVPSELPKQVVNIAAGERAIELGNKQIRTVSLPPGVALKQPVHEYGELIACQRVNGGEAVLKSRDTHGAPLKVDVGDLQVAELADAKTVNKAETNEAAVAQGMSAIQGGLFEPFDFLAGEIFTLAH